VHKDARLEVGATDSSLGERRRPNAPVMRITADEEEMVGRWITRLYVTTCEIANWDVNEEVIAQKP